MLSADVELADEGRLHPDLNLPRRALLGEPGDASSLQGAPAQGRALHHGAWHPGALQQAERPSVSCDMVAYRAGLGGPGAPRRDADGMMMCQLAVHAHSRGPQRAHLCPRLHLVRCRLVRLLSLERSLDTVVWQMLASVICPGKRCLSAFLRRAQGAPLRAHRTGPGSCRSAASLAVLSSLVSRRLHHPLCRSDCGVCAGKASGTSLQQHAQLYPSRTGSLPCDGRCRRASRIGRPACMMHAMNLQQSCT